MGIEFWNIIFPMTLSLSTFSYVYDNAQILGIFCRPNHIFFQEEGTQHFLKSQVRRVESNITAIDTAK